MILKENRCFSMIIDVAMAAIKKTELKNRFTRRKISSEKTKPEHRKADPDRLFVPKNTFLRGDLSSAGEVVIAGEVVGNVTCRQLTIKENALVKGDVTAEELFIYGEAFGAISAPRVTFQPTCHVEGPIYCNWFQLEQGAYFEGKMHRIEGDGSSVLPLVAPQADKSPSANPESRPQLALVG